MNGFCGTGTTNLDRKPLRASKRQTLLIPPGLVQIYVVSCAHCVLRHWFEEAEIDDNTANSLFLQVPEQIAHVVPRVGFVLWRR